LLNLRRVRGSPKSGNFRTITRTRTRATGNPEILQPITRDWAVATCCRMHGGAAGSGAPKGKRNGKYRHGGFTTEAIDERRRLAALIRDNRDFLSRLR